MTFLSAQFTNDFEVRVDAHSSSPIFVEDRKNDALTLFEQGVIDEEELLEMFDPPGLQSLKAKLPAIRARREQAKQAEEAAKGAKK